jgi:signal transduction histidine kinase/DNA-binding response OmpR family regulator
VIRTDEQAIVKHDKAAVLIVDDKPENLYALDRLLKKLDVEVVQALSGPEALNLALEHDFCVAIVDIQMPGMDGYELVELLRSNSETATLPVIFVSAIFSDEYHHRKGYEAGAVDFMSKPFTPEILLSKVKIFVELYQQRRALQQANVILSKRAVQLKTSSQVGQQVTSILELDELFKAVVKSIQSQFGYYFVGIWLLNDRNDKVVLRAGIDCQEQMASPDFSIVLSDQTNSVAQVCRSGEPCRIGDQDNKTESLKSEEPLTLRSELVLPLRVGQQTIGALDIWSEQEAAFDAEDHQVLQTLANQIAIAIGNALVYKLERDLRSVEEEKALALARLNADKDKFFSIISHDLRSPFNIVLGNARFLLKTIDSTSRQELQEVAQSIHNGAKAVYNLLENLLTWSRMQRAEGLVCEPEAVELTAVAQAVVEVLRPIAVQKEISLSNAIEPELWVQADRNMLETVVRNLTSNALKFTPRGGQVSLTASAGSVNGRSGFVTVSVKDTGVGMNEAVKANLFRLDTQHSTAGTENEPGTGLGLIICQEMVQRNGGNIWVESEPGKGTVMQFTVPQTVPPVPVPQDQPWQKVVEQT